MFDIGFKHLVHGAIRSVFEHQGADHAHALRKSMGQFGSDPGFAAQTAMHITPNQADPRQARGLRQGQHALHLGLPRFGVDAALVGEGVSSACDHAGHLGRMGCARIPRRAIALGLHGVS